MHWVPLALLALALLLLQPWRPFPDVALALPRSIAVILAGVAWAIWMLRVVRHRAYRRWPRAPRWAFLALTTVMTVCGGVWLAGAWSENMGWPATIWFFGAPFIYGLLDSWPRRARPTAPPA